MGLDSSVEAKTDRQDKRSLYEGEHQRFSGRWDLDHALGVTQRGIRCGGEVGEDEVSVS